jgi:hypothetical protein
MPWLPIYATESDAINVIDLLSNDPEIAFLIPEGKGRWRAVKTITYAAQRRLSLWHVPSGPLPLLQADHMQPDTLILDPWSGWEELRAGVNPNQPYFGAGPVGVVWLNMHTIGKDKDSSLGLSGFEWIGNHYRLIGNGAHPSAELWWKSLRKRIAKLSHKVARRGLSGTLRPEIYALPDAYSLLQRGHIADMNPPF